MTLVAGCLSLLLSVALAVTGVQVSGRATERARAQLAADAAALAAIAESGPHGGGEPEAAAADYARMNGAQLESCVCPQGATAMQVEVTVGDMTARARAVLEPELLKPTSGAFAATGMHPLLRAAVERLTERSAGRIYVTSGYRSIEEQQVLWQDALRRHGSAEAADDWVARPGHSMHEKGLAVDLGGDLTLAASLVGELGLPMHRPMSWEPHHFELALSPPAPRS